MVGLIYFREQAKLKVYFMPNSLSDELVEDSQFVMIQYNNTVIQHNKTSTKPVKKKTPTSPPFFPLKSNQ